MQRAIVKRNLVDWIIL